jgi:hypothetical protein
MTVHTLKSLNTSGSKVSNSLEVALVHLSYYDNGT